MTYETVQDENIIWKISCQILLFLMDCGGKKTVQLNPILSHFSQDCVVFRSKLLCAFWHAVKAVTQTMFMYSLVYIGACGTRFILELLPQIDSLMLYDGFNLRKSKQFLE